MSVYQAVYNRLTQWPQLTQLLADSTINPTRPAIYETWAPVGTPKPYINLVYNLAPDGGDMYKVTGTVSAEIFTDNADTLTAEQIGKEVKKALLTGDYLQSPESGTIRIYPGPFGFIPEDKPKTVHYSASFEVVYWDLETIKAIEEE